MKPQKLLVATKNPGKIKEIQQVLANLGIEVTAIDDFADIPEPEETGDTFAQNARDKARYYSQATGMRCLADDSGLVVDALGGEPGVRSARYAGVLSSDRQLTDKANTEKLLSSLSNIPDPRKARFICHIALAYKDEILLESTGVLEGVISTSPAGDNGFGYDPVFYLPESNCSLAQLTAPDKNAISHRGKALRQLATMIDQQ